MAIQINDNIRSNSNRPLDWKYGPYISTAQALSLIPLAQRYHGLSFGVYSNPGDLENSDINCFYFYNDLTQFKPCGGSFSFEWIRTPTDLVMQPSKGYIATNSITPIELTLPEIVSSDIIRIASTPNSRFRIIIPETVFLSFNGLEIFGYLDSVEGGNSIDVVSVSENTYIVNASIGNFEYPEP